MRCETCYGPCRRLNDLATAAELLRRVDEQGLSNPSLLDSQSRVIENLLRVIRTCDRRSATVLA